MYHPVLCEIFGVLIMLKVKRLGVTGLLLGFVAGMSLASNGATREKIRSPAKAQGKGNFVICLASDIAIEVGVITIPARQLFSGDNKFRGSLRQRFSTSSGLQIIGPADNDAASHAVITTESATLSVEVPCRRVNARSVLFEPYSWTKMRIPASLPFRFRAELWDVSPDFNLSMSASMNAANPAPLDYVRKAGGLNGMPVAEIGNPVRLADSKAR